MAIEFHENQVREDLVTQPRPVWKSTQQYCQLVPRLHVVSYFVAHCA